jgi:hypothetical protein
LRRAGAPRDAEEKIKITQKLSQKAVGRKKSHETISWQNVPFLVDCGHRRVGWWTGRFQNLFCQYAAGQRDGFRAGSASFAGP